MREKEFLPQIQTRLGIEELNEMQRRMLAAGTEGRDLILLSPTGTGKTLAFILPVLKMLRPSTGRVQAVVIAPSRELVMQIAGVLQKIGAGMKTTPLYGGHKFEDEENSLKAGCDIVVATPGRLLDHLKRRTFDALPTRILVLDEFDKSLELGFEEEMRKISNRLKNVSHMIMTSATRADVLPEFLKLNNPLTLDYLGENRNLRGRIRVHRVDADSKDKLESLRVLIDNIWADGQAGERAIVFVNHRESAERVAAYLEKQGYPAVLYHGAMDQRDRESAVARFNSGSRPILVATDLAARGLDIREVKSVIHYHQPLSPEAYTHRNGRTARVDADGDVYVLIGPEESVKDYIETDDTRWLDPEKTAGPVPRVETLYIGAGKKEKLSKGDILGFLVKQCGLEPNQIGAIDVRDHYSLTAVRDADMTKLLAAAKAGKIKGSRRQVSIM
ncbi:MAG: DEAD/DEAH box helicase [Bacteroidales bacterium]|nr:DEAD/DEAH box helicase [Bacteroidales bacterium]